MRPAKGIRNLGVSVYQVTSFVLSLTMGFYGCSQVAPPPSNRVKEEKTKTIIVDGNLSTDANARSLSEVLCKSKAKYRAREKLEEKYILLIQVFLNELNELDVPDADMEWIQSHLLISSQWSLAEMTFSGFSAKENNEAIDCGISGMISGEKLLSVIEREGREYAKSLFWIRRTGTWREIKNEVERKKLLKKQELQRQHLQKPQSKNNPVIIPGTKPGNRQPNELEIIP